MTLRLCPDWSESLNIDRRDKLLKPIALRRQFPKPPFDSQKPILSLHQIPTLESNKAITAAEKRCLEDGEIMQANGRQRLRRAMYGTLCDFNFGQSIEDLLC